MKAQDILNSARDAIEERSAYRDTDSGKSMDRTVRIFNHLTDTGLSERDGWLFLACVKLGRSQQGEFHADDYVDAASYIALAGEAAHGQVWPSRNGPEVCRDVQEGKADVHRPDADEDRLDERTMVDMLRVQGEETINYGGTG